MNGRHAKRTSQVLCRLLMGAVVFGAFSVTACSDDPQEDTEISTFDDVGLADSGADTSPDPDGSDLSDISDTDETDAQPDGQSGDTDSPDVDSPDSDDDTTDTDVDPGPTCPETPCQGSQICVEGRCLDDTPANKCAAAEDLGALSPGTPITIADSTAGASDILMNSCGGQGDEKVYKFTVSETSRVSFETGWPGQFDASVEFRFDGCEAPGSTQCFDANSDLSVNAGETVYLVVEQYVGRGNDFGLELSATAEDCTPGETTCNSGSLAVCGGDGNTITRECADTCGGPDECAGTVCANAIAMSGSANFAGDLAAYPKNFNFESNAECTVQDTPLPTPGAEVIFKLESLNAGQLVSITAGTNRAMFFTTDCQNTPVCDAALVGSGVDGTAQWTVPTGFVNQDVFLIIDGRNENPGDFNYDIDISTP